MKPGAYLRLARVQTSGVTATVPLYGYLAAAYALRQDMPAVLGRLEVVLPLVALGFCAHVFGFVHNEIADREVDARAGTVRQKPLPSGVVSVRSAWAVAGIGLKAGLLVAFGLALITDAAVFVLAAVAAALAAAYNYRGKSFAGGDALLAGSIACFVLAGAAAAGGAAGWTSDAAIGMAILAALVLFFNNAFEGGYKDHASDAAGGKRTLVLALRARSAKYDSPDGLLVFSSAIFHLLLLGVAARYVVTTARTGNLLEDLGRVVVAVVLTGAMGRLYVRGIAATERKEMLARFAAHEGLAVVLLISVLAPFTPWLAAVALFLAPVVVFAAANRSLYGTLAAPDV